MVQKLLAAHNLRPNKALGQNFLIDRNIIERILTAGAFGPADVVLEIGPGLGALTQGLLERGAQVVAVEKDVRLAGLLSEIFADEPRLRVVPGDALKVDLEAALKPVWSAARRGSSTPAFKVAANLPYYVTSPLLMRLIELVPPFEVAVVMVQQEVAERLTARPGDKAYGALTLAVGRVARVESAGRVPPTVFYPMPGVWSEIVVLHARANPEDVGDPELFRELVRAAFGMRRKTLINALKATGIDQDVLLEALGEAGIDPSRRGETLSLAEFSKLSSILCRKLLVL